MTLPGRDKAGINCRYPVSQAIYHSHDRSSWESAGFRHQKNPAGPLPYPNDGWIRNCFSRFCHDQPWRCLCFGFSQITRILPFLLMILHFSQIGFTDDLTFTLNLLSLTSLKKTVLYHNTACVRYQ